MTIRKKTIDNSVRYIAKGEKTKERDIKPKTKAGSLPRKQNKNISHNNKKFLKNISASGFGILKWKMNCYFWLKSILIPSLNRQKTQETLEFKMIRSKQTFSFNPPINLVEEGKWLIGVTLFDCTNSVFNITNENNLFSIIIPGHWQTKSDEKNY